MLDVYSKNNALGDPESIKSQLEENGKRLDACNEELHKYKVRVSGSCGNYGNIFLS